MRETKSYPLILGLAVPVLMVIFIAGSVFIPRLFAPSAQYDFVYSLSDGYNPEGEYVVRNGRIEFKDLKRSSDNDNSSTYSSVRLYRYYIKENRSLGISLKEAEKLNLSHASQSPDKFEIVPSSKGSSFLFFYSSYPNYGEMYLKGHGVGRELNLAQGREHPYYPYSNFRFVGWILQ